MLTLQCDLHGNHLLGALPSEEWPGFHPHLELAHLHADQLLCHSGQRIRRACFPTTAIVSTLKDGSSIEIAKAARDGVVGGPIKRKFDRLLPRLQQVDRLGG